MTFRHKLYPALTVFATTLFVGPAVGAVYLWIWQVVSLAGTRDSPTPLLFMLFYSFVFTGAAAFLAAVALALKTWWHRTFSTVFAVVTSGVAMVAELGLFALMTRRELVQAVDRDLVVQMVVFTSAVAVSLTCVLRWAGVVPKPAPPLLPREQQEER